MWALLCVAIGSGLLDLLAIARGWTKARYVWKPGTMVVIILLALQGADLQDSSDLWLLAGLVLSLVGDVFLMLPQDRFLAGLVSFFVAHVCYIVAFGSGNSTSWPALHPGLLAVLLLGFGLVYFLLLAKGVLRSGGPKLLFAVACYILIILGMVWRASATGNPWYWSGALLFLVSDSILAWNRFVRRALVFEVLVMLTYFAAQILLALGVSQ